jgi:hypothetical protein
VSPFFAPDGRRAPEKPASRHGSGFEGRNWRRKRRRTRGNLHSVGLEPGEVPVHHLADFVEDGRALDPKRTRGLIWNTQGSGKSILMVLIAKWLLEHDPEARIRELETKFNRLKTDNETMAKTYGFDLTRQYVIVPTKVVVLTALTNEDYIKAKATAGFKEESILNAGDKKFLIKETVTGAAEVEVQGQVGIIEVDRGAGAPLLALQIHQGIFDLQGAVVTVVEARSAAGGIDAEGGARRQPAAPVDGALHTVVELVLAATGKLSQFKQEPEGQAGL